MGILSMVSQLIALFPVLPIRLAQNTCGIVKQILLLCICSAFSYSDVSIDVCASSAFE